MSLFLFEAQSVDGKVLKGEVRAESESEARDKIRGQKLIPLKVSPKKGLVTPKAGKKVGLTSRVKSREVQAFTRQFASLIGAGIPIAQGLEVLESDSPRNLREILKVVLVNVETGYSLSRSLAVFSDVFGRMYVKLVQAGEESGSLPEILNQLAHYAEKSHKLKSKFTYAMWYPAIIFGVFLLISFLLFGFVIPGFVKMFALQSQTLPGLTVFVIGVSHIIETYWYIFVIIGLGFPISLIQFYKWEPGRNLMGYIGIQLPLLGNFIKMEVLAKVCRALSILLASNVKFLDAFDLVTRTTENIVMREALEKVKKDVMNGKSLSEALRSSPDFPVMVADMVHVGEQTGQLDYMFEKVTEFYEDEVERITESLFIMIEPTMMLVLGSMVAVVVVALYLPVFNMGATVELSISF